MINPFFIYNYNYKKVIKISETLSKKYLLSELKNQRDFNFAFNKMTDKLYKLKKEKEDALNKNFPNCMEYFKNRASYYKEDVEYNILKNEIQNEFTNESCKLKNSNNSFAKIIIDLGILESLNYCSSIIQNNSDIIKSMYLLDNFTNYQFDLFSSNSNLLSIKQKLEKDLYGKSKEVGIVVDDLDSAKKVNCSANISEIKEDLKKFNNKEKFIMLKLIYDLIKRNNESMSLVEFSKVMTITNDIYDYKLFTNVKTADLTFYTKLNKGIDYYNLSKLKKKQLINALISKTEQFNLAKIKELLILERRKL